MQGRSIHCCTKQHHSQINMFYVWGNICEMLSELTPKKCPRKISVQEKSI